MPFCVSLRVLHLAVMSKQILHHEVTNALMYIYRFYSLQWRTWGAYFIQVAWRRYCKRKLGKSLREAQDRLQNALANEVGSQPSLGATIYASRFAANALRALRKNSALSARPPQRLLPLLPQKPAEPDFTAEGR